MESTTELLRTSDKVFWHGYIEFYERQFGSRSFSRVCEIGVLRGHSIRWLLHRFPDARVWGADIMPSQPEWPQDARVAYVQLDQGEREALRQLFAHGFDLIIDDGSHIPQHQALSLVEGMRALAPGGLFLLEDIQTSHPRYMRKWWDRGRRPGNALSVLLAIDHYLRVGGGIDAARAKRIAAGSLLGPAEVQELANSIESLELYRRSRLPDSCFRCGSKDYDFSGYRCACGVELLGDIDSMSFAIRKKPAPQA